MEVPYIRIPKPPGSKKREPTVSVSDLVFDSWPEPVFGDPRIKSGPNKEFALRARELPLGRMALMPEEFELVSGSDEPTAVFEEVESFRVGREYSRQGVYFGNLSLSTMIDPTTLEFVAMKPFDRRRVKNFGVSPDLALTHEYAANKYLSRISSGTAYEPLGIWRRPPDTFFVPTLVTRFMENSTSLDNVFRGNVSATKEHVLRAFALGSFGLGLAHGAQIVHGDAYPQNFAINGMRVLFNDTTSLRPYSRRKDGVIDDKKTGAKIRTDIEDFVEGAFLPEVSSEEMREISESVLSGEDYLSYIYNKYILGAKLGSERSGLPRSSIIVGSDEHSKIIIKVVDKYKKGGYEPVSLH